MKRICAVGRLTDLVLGRRVFTACWLGASLGLSILQLRLLAQGWQESSHALVPACLVSLWTLGTLIGMRLPTAPRLWGVATITDSLLWVGSSSLVSWHLLLSRMLVSLLSMVSLGLLALLLGASSTAWLTQQRTWSALLALACCLPLLLDACASSRAPLPSRGSVAADWIRRYWQVDPPPLQLEHRAQPWNWLLERARSTSGYLRLTLLASGVAVILGSIWGAVPTPFAAGFSATHTLEKLSWLLGGQVGIVLLGIVLLLFAARGVIGFPNRLVPTSWQVPARLLMRVAPLGMATGLVALGLPFLQAPWWLAVSLGGYTLASAVWGLLLPRLRPTVSTLAQAQRHLLLGQGLAFPTAPHLAHSGAREAQVTRLLAMVEGLLIAACTPLLGWWIDLRGNVDPVLVSVGLGLLGMLLVGMTLAWFVPVVRRARGAHRAVLRTTRYRPPSAALQKLRPAW